jgi:hypothetical protein
MREARMMEGKRKDAMVNAKDEASSMSMPDANGAFAGEI